MKISRMVLTLFLFLLNTGGRLDAQDNDLSAYRWKIVQTDQKPAKRHESSMVIFEGEIYLIGGRGIHPVNVFNPDTNTWTERGKTPFEIHHFQAVPYKDRIYFLGAMTGKYPNETPLANIWIYKPKTDEWEKGDLIPEDRRRGGAGAVVYGDKIFIVCGIEFGHTSGTNNYFDSYDLKTGEWKKLTKAPHIRDHFSALVINHELYLIGGRNTSYHLPNKFGAFFGQTNPYIDVYNFETQMWITLKEKLPVPSAAGGLVHLNSYIIYFGGESGQKLAHPECYGFNLKKREWIQLDYLNVGRHGGGSVVLGDKVYTAAGSPKRGGGNMNSMEVFTDE